MNFYKIQVTVQKKLRIKIKQKMGEKLWYKKFGIIISG